MPEFRKIERIEPLGKTDVARFQRLAQECRKAHSETMTAYERVKTMNPHYALRLMGQADVWELVAFVLESETAPNVVPVSSYSVSLFDCVRPHLELIGKVMGATQGNNGDAPAGEN